MSVLGTTDDDYYGDLDDVRATSEEVRYLVQGVARVFPSVRAARAIGTYAGVRPTLYAYGPNEDALSREHEVVDHAADGAPGIYSMIGGKLASYRIFAQELSDLVAAREFDVDDGLHHARAPPPRRRARPRRARAGRGARDHAGRRATARLPPRGARAARPRARGAGAPRARRRVPVRAGARGGGAPRGPPGDGAHGRGRRAPHAARARRVRRDALRGAVRADRRGGARAAAGRRPARWRASFLERQARTRVVAMGPEQARQEALALAHVRASHGGGDVRGVARRRRGASAGTAAALAAARAGARVSAPRRRDRGVDAGHGRHRRQPWTAAGAAWRRSRRRPGPSSTRSAPSPSPTAGRAWPRRPGSSRPARGHDLALLDLAPLAGKRVAVARCERPGWDAAALVRAWGRRLRRDGGDACCATSTSACSPTPTSRPATTTRRASAGSRSDCARRWPRAGGTLRRRCVLPPSLGVERRAGARAVGPRRRSLRRGGRAARAARSGLRFERARDRAFAAAGVERVAGRVSGVERAGRIDGAPRASERPRWRPHAVVLAVGGLVGGGLEYSPGEAAAGLGAAARITTAVPARTSTSRRAPRRRRAAPGGARLALRHPAGVARVALRIRAGDGARGRARRRPRPRRAGGLYAAGEIVADAPRTWLRALESGARAGSAAAARRAHFAGCGAACHRLPQHPPADLEQRRRSPSRDRRHVRRLACRSTLGRRRRARVARRGRRRLRLRRRPRRSSAARGGPRGPSRGTRRAPSSFVASTATSGCTPSAWIACPLGV